MCIYLTIIVSVTDSRRMERLSRLSPLLAGDFWPLLTLYFGIFHLSQIVSSKQAHPVCKKADPPVTEMSGLRNSLPSRSSSWKGHVSSCAQDGSSGWLLGTRVLLWMGWQQAGRRPKELQLTFGGRPSSRQNRADLSVLMSNKVFTRIRCWGCNVAQLVGANVGLAKMEQEQPKTGLAKLQILNFQHILHCFFACFAFVYIFCHIFVNFSIFCFKSTRNMQNYA